MDAYGWTTVEDTPVYEQLVSGWFVNVGPDGCKTASKGYALDWSYPSPITSKVGLMKEIGRLLADDYVARMISLLGSREKLLAEFDKTAAIRAGLDDQVQMSLVGKIEPYPKP